MIPAARCTRRAVERMTDMKGFLRARKNDIILIGVLVLVTLALFAAFSLFSGEGERVRVTVNGEYFGEYSLKTDREIDILGGNTLTISGGRAFMSQADCPHRICMLRGAVSRSGQSIICLPNGVVVTVLGPDGADAVAN